MTRPLRAGEQVLLIDGKQRLYLVTLVDDGSSSTPTPASSPTTSSSAGRRAPSSRSTTGARFTAFRPTLADFVLKMPRGRPGDLSEGPRADPDARRRLPRRQDPRVGRRIGGAVDDAAAGRRRRRRLRAARRLRRPGPGERGRRSSATTRSAATGSSCVTATTGIDETDLDRVLLDLPEPWQVVKHAERALHPGGILVAYTPTIVPGRRSSGRRSTPRPSGSPTPSRCCSGAGTSRASRSGPITGWWPTPASSPRPGCSAGDRSRRR